MEGYLGGLWLTRLVFQRGLAAIYWVAFVCALNQFRPLLGEKGLLPVPRFLELVPFREAPSLFHAHYSDRFFAAVAWLGIALSTLAVTGLSEAGPLWLSMLVWLTLWALYLSIVNVGQTFYEFGWESMLVEAGFFAAFLGPARLAPSAVPIVVLRWMLFRVELGAGLIKLRHDPCWRNLTCLFYHHETQPMPNPLAWYAHHLPRPVLRAGVVFSHFVQVGAPLGLFAPQPIASVAGALIIAHQLLLISTGNYAWLNWLTIVLGVTSFGDAELGVVTRIASPPALEPRPVLFDAVLAVLAAATAMLSVRPLLNFFSRNQLMNHNFNSLHLVNVYGAFGSVTRERYEVIVEGTADAQPSAESKWKAYGFKGQPGDPRRGPPQVAPYHLRLDWLMWFLPLTLVRAGRLVDRDVDPWFLHFVVRLLRGDRQVTALLRDDPFAGAPPRFVRAHVYRYAFTNWAEKRATGAWWTRSFIGELLPPTKLAPPGARRRRRAAPDELGIPPSSR
jgi:hypothetical protein